MDDVLDLERYGWEAIVSGKGREFYDSVMTDEAIMILPGMMLDRDQVLDSWRGSPPWQSYELSDERVVEASPDTAIVTYRATAMRDESPVYHPLMSTVYVRHDGRWRLALHQQTPLD